MKIPTNEQIEIWKKDRKRRIAKSPYIIKVKDEEIFITQDQVKFGYALANFEKLNRDMLHSANYDDTIEAMKKVYRNCKQQRNVFNKLRYTLPQLYRSTILSTAIYGDYVLMQCMDITDKRRIIA